MLLEVQRIGQLEVIAWYPRHASCVYIVGGQLEAADSGVNQPVCMAKEGSASAEWKIVHTGKRNRRRDIVRHQVASVDAIYRVDDVTRLHIL